LCDLSLGHGSSRIVCRLENQAPDATAKIDYKRPFSLIGQNELDNLVTNMFFERLNGCHPSVNPDAERKQKMFSVDQFHNLRNLCLNLCLKHDRQTLNGPFGTNTLTDAKLRQNAGTVRLARHRSAAPFDPDTRLRLRRRYRER